jgi:hypothetical protein
MERYSDARSAPPEQERGRADPRAACNVTTPRRYSPSSLSPLRSTSWSLCARRMQLGLGD